MRSLLGMWMPFLLGILFFIGGTPSFAQENSVFECTVVGPDQKPLSGATVHVLNTAFAAISDKDGHAVIKGLGKGMFLIECSFAGYASIVQEIDTRSLSAHTFRLFPRTVQLDEVVVTAEKREVAIQRLPLSVTSFSAEKTKDYRLWNTRDLSVLSPNLYSTHSGDERNVTGIRGITTTSYTPAVATYIDGVSQFSLDTYIATLFDVERIEVLRGPQGTLYGRNAMGGVINVITKMPTNETRANAELNFGNFGLQRHSVSVRLPLVKDRLFMGMAAQMQKRDGFYQNTETGSSYDKQRALVSNYFLHYRFDRHWSIRLNTKQQQQRNDGPFPLAFGTQQAFGEAYKLGYNALGRMNDRTSNTSLVVQYDGPRVLMTAQSAYQRNYRFYENPLDGDFSSLDAISVANNYGKDWNNVKVWTQEIRFSNPSGSSSPLQWTAGMYFFRQDNPVKQATLFGKDAGLLGIPDANSSLINISKEKVNGQAFFGQTSYKVGNKITLIAGLRFDREGKDLSVRGEYEKTGVGNFVIRTDTGSSRNFNAFSPKVGIQYQPAKGHQYYVTLTRGYRPGGFTPMNSDPSQPPLYPYDPEFSLNGEAGMKHTWMDGRWVLNFAAFYSVVTNIQVPTLVLPDAITLIRNTGKMVSAGVELEGSAIPVRGLQLDYAFGITNARYRSLTVSSNGQSIDLKGKRQLFTPDRTGLIAMQYTIPLQRASNRSIIARAEWVHTGNTWFDLSNSIQQSAYSVLNARFGWMGKKTEIYCWGRNLSGKKFIAYAYDFGAIHLGDPRTYGITLIGKL